MKFTLSWLKDYLDTDASAEAIGEALTSLGLEVESTQNPAARLAAFTVAEILEAAPHPDADRLRICTVKTASDTRRIVCGAPNARAGIKVALADIGAIIPNGGFEIKKSKIRGVESLGMLCSAKELGLGDDHAGILELPQAAAIGEPVTRALGMDDIVIDIAITPNRGDCLGVYGVARELAAKGLGTLKRLDISPVAPRFAATRQVRLETPACPYFVGRSLRGLTNGESPEWLKARLKAIGLRPISALVDITNYFTHAYGRPLHVYDEAKIEGDIVARPSRQGETLEALNDKTYSLPAGLCAIADRESVLGLGGVMGGKASGCSAGTTRVFLESAWFEPEAVAQTGRALNIDSDARYRFERRVDPAFVAPAAELATAMILEICGGEASELVIAGRPPAAAGPIELSSAAIRSLSGMDFAEREVETLLESLGFSLDRAGDGWSVVPPSYRLDIRQPADVIEELVRLKGYDHLIETALPPAETIDDGRFAKGQALRRTLAARGLSECFHFAFDSARNAEWFRREDQATEAVTILNPINAEEDRLRTSLLPGLLAAAARNLARARNDLALFEIGTVFFGLNEAAQPLEAAGIRLGQYAPTHWEAKARASDPFDAKADLLAALGALGVDPAHVQTAAAAPAYFHPGRSGTLRLGPKLPLGYFGTLHPKWLRAFDLPAGTVAFEVRIDAIPERRAKARGALKLSDYQPVTRDFAFIADLALSAGELLQALAGSGRQWLKQVQLFDVYQGQGVPEGKRSLAFTVTLQADDRTLEEADIAQVAAAIIAAAAKKGATLRA